MTHLNRFHPLYILATFFWSGCLPKAPGTWGTLAALPAAYGILLLGGPIALAISAAALFLAGIPAANWLGTQLGKPDAGMIVVDEVAAMWLVLLVVPLSPLWWALAFAAFRLFDITKPAPIGWLDKTVKGGFGVMLDDMVAALYAVALLYVVQAFIAAL
ncbi:MAG: phosphatidylglycerophosphatase A [Proteobacteria bacterium]|nr:phosphatidylglycerophosphatase A [Pseudomonadota bacterium]